MVVLYNAQRMSRKLKKLQQNGHPVDADVLKVVSPYRRERLACLGKGQEVTGNVSCRGRLVSSVHGATSRSEDFKRHVIVRITNLLASLP